MGFDVFVSLAFLPRVVLCLTSPPQKTVLGEITRTRFYRLDALSVLNLNVYKNILP